MIVSSYKTASFYQFSKYEKSEIYTVGNLIGDKYLNFYENVVSILTSLVLTVFCSLVFFHNSPSVKWHCRLPKK